MYQCQYLFDGHDQYLNQQYEFMSSPLCIRTHTWHRMGKMRLRYVSVTQGIGSHISIYSWHLCS